MSPSLPISRFARLSLWCGLASLAALAIAVGTYQPALLLVFFASGGLALFLGIAGLVQIVRSAGKLGGKGQAWWGIVLAPFGFVVGSLSMPAT